LPTDLFLLRAGLCLLTDVGVRLGVTVAVRLVLVAARLVTAVLLLLLNLLAKLLDLSNLVLLRARFLLAREPDLGCTGETERGGVLFERERIDLEDGLVLLEMNRADVGDEGLTNADAKRGVSVLSRERVRVCLRPPRKDARSTTPWISDLGG
jgi:hypothetical protein